MDTIFEVRYKRDEEIAKEVAKHIFFRSAGRIAMDIFLALYFVYFVYISFSVGKFQYPMIMAPLIFALQIYQYFRYIQLLLKYDADSNNGEPLEIACGVTEEEIFSFNGGDDFTFTFDRIERAYAGKKLILLKTKTNILYILPRNAFVKGTAEQFIAFLRSKNIKGA